MKKSVFRFIKEYYDEILGCLFLSIIVLLVVVNVIMRYIFSRTISWAEEFTTISFVWCVFLSSAACFRRQKHIGIDIIVERLPKVPRRFAKVFADLCVLVMTAYICYLSIVFCSHSLLKTTAIIGLPYIFINSSLAVAFLLMLVHIIRFLWRDIRILLGKV